MDVDSIETNKLCHILNCKLSNLAMQFKNYLTQIWDFIKNIVYT